MRYMSCPSHSRFITCTIFGEQYRTFGSTLCCLLHPPCYLVRQRPKYSSQQAFLTHCRRPSFTPIQNNSQNCIVLCFLISNHYKEIALIKYMNKPVDCSGSWIQRRATYCRESQLRLSAAGVDYDRVEMMAWNLTCEIHSGM